MEQVGQGPAASAGMQVGDVILAVNGDVIRGIDDLRKELNQNNNSVALLVMRGDQKMYIPIKLG